MLLLLFYQNTAGSGGGTYAVEEEIEDRGVENGLDLVAGPVVPGALTDGPLRLDGGGGGERAGGGGVMAELPNHNHGRSDVSSPCWDFNAQNPRTPWYGML